MQNKEPKVSLISPCYNGEKYLKPFFDSLVSQSYSNVEFIFIDDGSTDATPNIYKEYEALLKEKGWVCKYIYKENGGQASALNLGLKIFTGDYLIYPDSDDILYPNHIADKVLYMEEHSLCGIAYCTLDVVKENDLDNIIGQYSVKPSEDMFANALNEKEILWTPIGNIIRASSLLEVCKSRDIYEGLCSQNCQIQLPLLYKYPCGFIPMTLGKYVIRNTSSSRTKKVFKRRVNLMFVWINTIYRSYDIPFGQKLYFCFIVVKNNLKKFLKLFLQEIFSVVNRCINDQPYKLITILGVKIKIRRKRK